MNTPESGGPEMPSGLTVQEAIEWMNRHYPTTLRREAPVVGPNWYENLSPLRRVEQLHPHLFGVVNDENTQYGWAKNGITTPDNFRIQKRAAQGLVDFTQEKNEINHLYRVYTSLESDGQTQNGYRFSPPEGAMEIPINLRRFEAARDIKGAAQYTARVLFAPWR